jgi:ArsR family transcriptional regulator
MENLKAVGIFAALAQETRLEIFLLLVRAGGDGLSAGVIATTLGAPTTTLSFHLKELKSAGVIFCTRQGRSLIYRPDFSVMGDMINFLTAHCCEGIATISSNTPTHREN